MHNSHMEFVYFVDEMSLYFSHSFPIHTLICTNKYAIFHSDHVHRRLLSANALHRVRAFICILAVENKSVAQGTNTNTNNAFVVCE